MRAGLKIINSFCSLPTCSETKCKMDGKKSKLFSVSFYIRHLCCSKCPRIYFSANVSDTVYSDKVPLGCCHTLLVPWLCLGNDWTTFSSIHGW